MKITLLAIIVSLAATTAHAAECRSVAGHIDGQHATAVRTVTLGKHSIRLGGTFNGSKAPARTLPCKIIAKGVFCDTKFQGVTVTVQTNGSRMIEVVTDHTGREVASMAYECSQLMKP